MNKGSEVEPIYKVVIEYLSNKDGDWQTKTIYGDKDEVMAQIHGTEYGVMYVISQEAYYPESYVMELRYDAYKRGRRI